MLRSMDGPTELWRMRKEFTLQLASSSFITYVLALSSRIPARFHVSRGTGQIALSEVLPGMTPLFVLTFGVSLRSMALGIPSNQASPLIGSPDIVPFRLTPNLQHFIGPIRTEGLLAPSIMAIARSLTDSDVRGFFKISCLAC